MHLEALGKGELEGVDWKKVKQPPKHPSAFRVTEKFLYDLITGEEASEAKPGWRYYWRHDHWHLCRDDWDGETGWKKVQKELESCRRG